MMHKTLWATLLLIIGIAIVPTPIAQAQDLDLEDLIELAAADIDDYWDAIFDDLGLDYDTPEIVIFDDEVRTSCGLASTDFGPFYCSLDDTIYLTEGFMQFQLDNVGDFAVALIVAHEWGHYVQDELRVLGRGLSIRRELQADCYAGAWAQYAAFDSERVVLEQGDIEEGAIALFLVGDREAAWFERGAHGSARQRLAAFTIGFQNGWERC